jgi:hypothetical protein
MNEAKVIEVADIYRSRSDVPVVQNSQQTAITPMAMLQMAVSQNADLDKLTQLMALQERWEANEARKAFTKALSDFKAQGVVIGKDKHVSFATSKGKTEYNHATLGNVCDVIGKALSEFGLSYRWATEQVEGKIKVTCVLMHVLGHSESVSLQSGADESGGKNSIQAIGSTVSYLQRYTLLAITGTATQEQDDDGKSFGLKDVMDEGVMCDYLAAIESADSKSAVAKVYLQAIEAASGLADQEAMNRLNAGKDAALSKLSEKK